jgi:hypothetical protein
MLHSITKVVMTLGLLSGPVLLLAGLGMIEAPAPLIRANGGTGPDKGDWGAIFFATTRANVLILCGAAKVLALADVWILKTVPQIACFCVAVMMGLICYAHKEIGDDLPPPLFIGMSALVTMATWPDAEPDAKGKRS